MFMNASDTLLLCCLRSADCCRSCSCRGTDSRSRGRGRSSGSIDRCSSRGIDSTQRDRPAGRGREIGVPAPEHVQGGLHAHRQPLQKQQLMRARCRRFLLLAARCAFFALSSALGSTRLSLCGALFAFAFALSSALFCLAIHPRLALLAGALLAALLRGVEAEQLLRRRRILDDNEERGEETGQDRV